MISALAPGLDVLARSISWALIHTLWQGGLIALGLFATLTLLRRKSAALRYTVSCAALAALFLVAVGGIVAIIYLLYRRRHAARFIQLISIGLLQFGLLALALWLLKLPTLSTEKLRDGQNTVAAVQLGLPPCLR